MCMVQIQIGNASSPTYHTVFFSRAMFNGLHLHVEISLALGLYDTVTRI